MPTELPALNIECTWSQAPFTFWVSNVFFLQRVTLNHTVKASQRTFEGGKISASPLFWEDVRKWWSMLWVWLLCHKMLGELQQERVGMERHQVLLHSYSQWNLASDSKTGSSHKHSLSGHFPKSCTPPQYLPTSLCESRWSTCENVELEYKINGFLLSPSYCTYEWNKKH